MGKQSKAPDADVDLCVVDEARVSNEPPASPQRSTLPVTGKGEESRRSIEVDALGRIRSKSGTRAALSDEASARRLRRERETIPAPPEGDADAPPDSD